jgi:ubiquinol-cytochrome c reductase cytochrome c subunit
VLLLLALLVTGGLYAALAPTPAGAAEASESDIEFGSELFQANCASCHGMNAEGTQDAPSLIGVGAASVDFQVGTGRMPMENNGPQALAKAPQFDDEQVKALAAYVASLGAGPAIPTAEQVDPAEGDVANGMQLFRTNCAMCHNAVGAGGALSEGKFAPALWDSSPTVIYEAMVTGPQAMPVFNDANLTPEEKRDIISYIVAQRDGSPGGAELGALGPVTEGIWAWVIGIGLLIAASIWMGAKSS